MSKFLSSILFAGVILSCGIVQGECLPTSPIYQHNGNQNKQPMLDGPRQVEGVQLQKADLSIRVVPGMVHSLVGVFVLNNIAAAVTYAGLGAVSSSCALCAAINCCAVVVELILGRKLSSSAFFDALFKAALIHTLDGGFAWGILKHQSARLGLLLGNCVLLAGGFFSLRSKRREAPRSCSLTEKIGAGAIALATGGIVATIFCSLWGCCFCNSKALAIKMIEAVLYYACLFQNWHWLSSVIYEKGYLADIVNHT
ncbi:MAG: hypothetical protein LBF72_01215 [Holosporales bacterium]|nr:hypothetical protein [Holosporales bacterium]